MTVRTRFAPSPTGRLHLGNVRTAAFNWLFARHHGGAFVLRIEDTDVDRNVAGGEEGILQDLRWLGLAWDEGPDVDGPHGPYRQSERREAHQELAARLVAAGRAYPCWCTEEELRARAVVGKDGREVLRYDGRCRTLDPEERGRLEAEGRSAVLRFAVPEGMAEVEIQDEVFGPISFPGSDIDDFVIRRTDGRATYNFAVVADDVAMEITHVVRGVGHLSNTPKQALLFDALDAPRPVFAHLPTVLGTDGRKLSKRTGATAVAELREAGYPPDGVLNYLSLLGWSHPGEEEVLEREELVATIGLDRIGRSDTQLDPEKLRWICGQHLSREELEELTAHVLPHVDPARFPGALRHPRATVDALRSRLSTYGEIDDHLPLLFPPADGALEEARDRVAADPDARRVVEGVRDRLSGLPEEAWRDPGALSGAVRDAGSEAGARGKALFQPLRLALSGAPHGPDLGKTLAAVGREESLDRLARTVQS
jgi:glutamyl-tRNA synthetase